jgi:hypothetical protein
MHKHKQEKQYVTLVLSVQPHQHHKHVHVWHVHLVHMPTQQASPSVLHVQLAHLSLSLPPQHVICALLVRHPRTPDRHHVHHVWPASSPTHQATLTVIFAREVPFNLHQDKHHVCYVRQVISNQHLVKLHVLHVQLVACPQHRDGQLLTVYHVLLVSTWTKLVNQPVSTVLKAMCHLE